MKKSNLTLNDDKIKEAVIESLQFYAKDLKSVLDRYTLVDTGNLIDSGVLQATDTGISIQYGADYFSYVYHNQNISPKTPGTTSFWDTTASESSEFDDVLKLVKQRAIDSIMSKIGG